MNLIQAILMGVVQGLSEFLPISSSAHLVFASNFYKVLKGIEMAHSNEEVFFDIMLHLGTLIAVLIFFRKDISDIVKALYVATKTKSLEDHNAKTGMYIILGTIITIALALPLNSVAEKLVFAPVFVGILLVITGFLLLMSEDYSKKQINKSAEINRINSIRIAIAQGLAVLPGFSRSGWTIAAGLFSGLDRVTAARYSFLLSIPIILGASMVYPLVKIDIHEALTYNWTAIIVGTLISGVVGYLCIKYFLKFVSKFSLGIFGYYCIIVGIVTSVFFHIYS